MHRRSIDSSTMHSNIHSTRATDISRLLDPSYSSSSSSSSHNVHAYVDRLGELHDPDYRYFPVAAQPKRTTSPHRSSAYNMAARPRWELIDENALDLDEDELEEDFSTRLYNNNNHHHYSKRNSNSNSNSNTRGGSFTSLTRSYTPTPTPVHVHPQSHPHSFDSDDGVLDEYAGDDAEDAAFMSRARDTRLPTLLRTTFTRDRKRRASSLLSEAPTPALTDASGSLPSATTARSDSPSPRAQRHSLPALPLPLSPHTSIFAHYPVRSASRQHHYPEQEWDKEAREQEEREQREREMEREREREEELERREQWTPTCGQALRREWQAVTLRIRFSVFRTQRKIKNRFL